MGHGAVAVAELPVIVALEAGVGVVVGNGECIDKGVSTLDFRAEELVESVLIDTLACYGTTKTPQTAAGKWEFPQVHYTALKGQCSSEVGNYILEVFILGGIVGDDIYRS